MAYTNDYSRVGDLEVEGKLQLGDPAVSDCQCSMADARCTPGCTPDAGEFESCVTLVNELKDKLNALVDALT